MTGHLSAEEIAVDLEIPRSLDVMSTRNVVSVAHDCAIGDGAERYHIYFVQQGDDGPIKIGKAKGLAARVASLQCANPTPLRLLAHFSAAGAVETALHKHFRRYRVRGEWFEPAAPILAYIERVKNRRSWRITP